MGKRELCAYCSDTFKGLFTRYGYGVSNQRTLYEYTGYINLLCEYIKKDFLDIEDADADSYMSYMLNKVSEGSLTRQTVCVRLSCYKAVSRFVDELDEIDGYYNAFEKVHRPEIRTYELNPAKIPTLKELDAVMSAAKADPKYYLILALATRVGLTVTNIVNIKRNCVIEENGRLFIYIPPANDFRSERYVMLPQDVQKLMESYLADYKQDDSGYIFIIRNKNPLTIRNIDSAVSKYIKASGIDKHYTMKDLRTRAILELVEAGADPDVIGEYTGLRRMRVNAFVNSSGLVSGTCPADLVNYQIRA